MAPAEANVCTLQRTMMPQNTELNDSMLLENLDTLEEQRDQALLRVQNYQQLAAQYYNKKSRTDISTKTTSSLGKSTEIRWKRRQVSSGLAGKDHT